jgi:hypothetical protein
MIATERDQGLQNTPACATLDSRQRALWLGVRQGLLIALGAIETYLDIDRTRPPKRTRI